MIHESCSDVIQRHHWLGWAAPAMVSFHSALIQWEGDGTDETHCINRATLSSGINHKPEGLSSCAFDEWFPEPHVTGKAILTQLMTNWALCGFVAICFL